MNTTELRQAFLDFFRKKGHEIVQSSPLVPTNDQSLLFTNAGMVQFKSVFLGEETREYSRAASSQFCLRAGGKHNDLENVGYTDRHHTFFEMLGNFSFGDYFKKEAICYAWEFITQVLKLPEERLWITVFEEDNETADIWLKTIQIDPHRFSRCGMKNNFWSMGEIGPCGPCSEIFYDHGTAISGGPPGSPEEDGARYVEIWNLVFMQYNRNASGQLTPLPKPSVDTGMGLERVAAVMQQVHSNYDIDIFKRLIQSIAKLTETENLKDNSLRVIADHVRLSVFLVTEGILPANDSHGYVLRRIMRRAIRHGHKLGMKEPFLCELVLPLVEEMGESFLQLYKSQAQVEQIFLKEEIQFAKTLEQGMLILENVIQKIQVGGTIPGEIAFKLYDTYGFPLDLTVDIARERNIELDMEGFNKAMAEQQAMARHANPFIVDTEQVNTNITTEFLGYDKLVFEGVVKQIFQNEQPVKILQAGTHGILILDKSPFYAESGGQVGDSGFIRKKTITFEVSNTRKIGQAHGHHGFLKSGTIQPGDVLISEVDAKSRDAIQRNHTATHLLHAAIRKILGNNVHQKGSIIDTKRLRFDISHFKPISKQQLLDIEQLVNKKILENTKIETHVMPIKEARTSDAIALFGEKYDKIVRVIQINGNFSKEFCCGTHAKRTGDIGLFKITSESGIAAGIRRVEAITGNNTLSWSQEQTALLIRLAALLKVSQSDLELRLEQHLLLTKNLDKKLDQVQTELATGKCYNLANKAKNIKGIKVLAITIPTTNDSKSLRNVINKLKSQLGTAVIVLATLNGQKINLLSGVTNDCISKIKANDLVNYVAQLVGGQGGGRADIAQAGGNQPEKLHDALESVFSWVEGKL